MKGSKHPGKYRLPSEAEWEYAARAGTSTRFVWGDQLTHDAANLGKEDGPPFGPFTGAHDRWLYTSPAGSFPPNRWGLYDMAGNVAQIMDDCRRDFQSGYVGAPSDGSVWKQDDCRAQTVRGSAWDAPLKYSGVAGRGAVFPTYRMAHVGFRVVKVLD
jgi:formylglycine-generating enzyme required for sulfatase activity